MPQIRTLCPSDAKELILENKNVYSDLILDGITNLYEDSASILANYPGKIVLNDLTRISESAADALSAHTGGLSLMGMRNISHDLAESLLAYQGELNLPDNIPMPGILEKAHAQLLLKTHSGQQPLRIYDATELSWEAAHVLAEHEGPLLLNNIKSLTTSCARMLANKNGELQLNSVEIISELEALALANHRGELQLRSLINLDVYIASSLVNHQGPVFLDKINSVTQEVAILLASQTNDIRISINHILEDNIFEVIAQRGEISPFELHNFEFKSLNPVSARFLITHLSNSYNRNGFLDLDNLEYLCEMTSDVICQFKGGLFLNGLKMLDVDAAESLSNHQGILNLDGLTTLDENVAAALGKHQGSISLNGLASISDRSAHFISTHQGDIFLDGLTSIRDSSAISFSKHRGVLSLEGIMQISSSAAALLANRHEDSPIRGLRFLEDLKIYTPGTALLCSKLGYNNSIISLNAEIAEIFCKNWNWKKVSYLEFPCIRTIDYCTATVLAYEWCFKIRLRLIYIKEDTQKVLFESRTIKSALCLPSSETSAEIILARFHRENKRPFEVFKSLSQDEFAFMLYMKDVYESNYFDYESRDMLYMEPVYEGSYFDYKSHKVEPFNPYLLGGYFDKLRSKFPESAIWFNEVSSRAIERIRFIELWQDCIHEDYMELQDAWNEDRREEERNSREVD